MRRKILRAIFLPGAMLCTINLFAQSPGGVTGQALWLKGNLSADPSRKSLLNFQPALLINGSSESLSAATSHNTKQLTVFTVYRQPGSLPVWQLGSKSEGLSLTGTSLVNKEAKSVINCDVALTGAPTLHVYSGTGFSVQQPAENIEFGGAAGGEQGQLAEFIQYNRILKDAEVEKIESYLALKYAITILHDYTSADGQMIWPAEKNKAFHHFVTGIGRDDRAGLYQKQSQVSDNPHQLLLSAGDPAVSNQANTSIILNGDFLVCGENEIAAVEEKQTAAAGSGLRMSASGWLMQVTGNTAHRIKSTLRITDADLMPFESDKHEVFLVIDRSGSGHFLSEQCEWFPAVWLPETGQWQISNLYWDTDHSGTDLFTLAVKAKNPSGPSSGKDEITAFSIQAQPNPVTDKQYRLLIQLPYSAPLHLAIYDQQNREIISRDAAVTGKSALLLTGPMAVPAGIYTVVVTCGELRKTQLLIVQ